MESYMIDPLEYSEVAHLHVRGPSHTSTLMVRHTGGNVYPESTFEKEPLKETEKEDWRFEFKSITSEIVSKTIEVLLKLLKEQDQNTKKLKDLLDEEIAEMRCELTSLKPSPQSDTVTPKVIVTAPVSMGTSSVDNPNGPNDLNPHTSRMDNYRWLLDSNGQPIYVPPVAHGTCSNGSKTYKRQVLLLNMKSLNEL